MNSTTSEKIDHALVPRHVAIIMDGNGRWATRQGYPRVFGHIRGCKRVKEVVKEADRLGVKVLTLYAFSTENWQRSKNEVGILWKLLKKYLKKEVEELNSNNVRLSTIGETHRLPEDVQGVLHSAISQLRSNTGLELVLALSYGARREIVNAAKAYAEDRLSGKLETELSEQMFSSYLWNSGLSDHTDVDFLIRTGGDRRISNFLLWQSAYCELFFTDTCWPEFDGSKLKDAVREFSLRERKFGIA